MSEPTDKLINFDITPDKLCDTFGTIPSLYSYIIQGAGQGFSGFYKFIVRNNAKLSDLDDKGRNILHHVFIQKCNVDSYSSFDAQFNQLYQNKVNYLIRDADDKFAFDYADTKHMKPAYYPAIPFILKETVAPYSRGTYHFADMSNKVIAAMMSTLNSVKDPYRKHLYSGNNLLHKFAEYPNLITAYIDKKVSPIQKTAEYHGHVRIFAPHSIETSSNHDFRKLITDIESKLMEDLYKYVIFNSNPYLANLKGKQPMDLAIKSNDMMAAALYKTFLSDMHNGMEFSNIYPFLLYGFKNVIDRSLINLLKKRGYQFDEHHPEYDGNNILQIILSSINNADNWNKNTNEQKGEILHLLWICKSSLDWQNDDKVSLRDQLKQIYSKYPDEILQDIIATPEDNFKPPHPCAPKTFESIYNAIRNKHLKGENSADEKHVLEKMCSEYSPHGQEILAFCIDPQNYNFNQEWTFV